MVRAARDEGVDLRKAALRFFGANPVVSSLVPGASHPDQVGRNAEAFRATIPAGFWSEMKNEGAHPPARAGAGVTWKPDDVRLRGEPAESGCPTDRPIPARTAVPTRRPEPPGATEAV